MTLSIKPLNQMMEKECRRRLSYRNTIPCWSHYLLGGSRCLSGGRRRRVRLLLRTLWTPRTRLLLVLGGIGGFHTYYNSYFDIVVIAPFNLKGTVIPIVIIAVVQITASFTSTFCHFVVSTARNDIAWMLSRSAHWISILQKRSRHRMSSMVLI